MKWKLEDLKPLSWELPFCKDQAYTVVLRRVPLNKETDHWMITDGIFCLQMDGSWQQPAWSMPYWTPSYFSSAEEALRVWEVWFQKKQGEHS